jgi:hypothetical protein
MRLNIVPKSLWKASATNNSTNDLGLTNVPKIQKTQIRSKKLGENDIK